MDATTLDIVLALNPWRSQPGLWGVEFSRRLPTTWIERSVGPGLARTWGERDQAHLLVGPRQAGKTSLVWKHLADLGPGVIFLTMEDVRIRTWCTSPAVFLRDLREEIGAPSALFLDEVQHHPEAALFLKGLVDLRPGFPVIVTGSAAFHLQSRTRESLAGRASRATLLPLAAGEILPTGPALGKAATAARDQAVILRHVRYGGYPRAWTSGAPERVLDALVAAFLDHDASDFFRIQRPDAMARLLRLAAGQVGNLVNLSEWASLCAISRDTVAAYLQILEDSHLVRLLPVFAGGRRAELTAAQKVFFLDNGLRNALLRDWRPPGERVDAGAVWENWVFSELAKRIPSDTSLYYWRTHSGAEVDFVTLGTSGPTGVEVKAAAMTSPRLSRSARSFIEAYQPPVFVVLNAALEHEERLGASMVRWVPFTRFAAQSLEGRPGGGNL